MRTTKKFYWIKINLTHRLARKIVKAIDELPEDDIKYNYRLKGLRRYLAHMWKGNYRRYQKGARKGYSVIKKRVGSRVLYIGTQGNLHINNDAPSNNYADSMLINTNDLIKYICNMSSIPF